MSLELYFPQLFFIFSLFLLRFYYLGPVFDYFLACFESEKLLGHLDSLDLFGLLLFLPFLILDF